MNGTPIHRLSAESFPLTIYSRTGELIWSKTVERPKHPTDLEAVGIPGYAGTEHYPVRVEIEYADGTTGITGPS
jgi:hypothetical protein